MSLPTIQLICSFFIGGAVVALQLLAAEKVPKAISGIVLCLPSTIIVNFYFLGLILKPSEFDKLLPLIPAPIGISLLFIAAYIYIAKWLDLALVKLQQDRKQKIFIIVITALMASGIWLAMSLPFAIYEFDNFILSLIIFAILAWISHWIMVRGSRKYKEEKLLHYTVAQQLGRAVFAGLMVATTVYFGHHMGAFWGGVIAMFPAAFLASIAIIHYYYNQEILFSFFKTVPLGSTTLILYAWIAHYSFPAFGVMWGTCACVIVSLFYSWLLSLKNSN